MKATLILASGAVFTGRSIGSTADRVCEMVFNTSMTGYQEIDRKSTRLNSSHRL